VAGGYPTRKSGRQPPERIRPRPGGEPRQGGLGQVGDPDQRDRPDCVDHSSIVTDGTDSARLRCASGSPLLASDENLDPVAGGRDRGVVARSEAGKCPVDNDLYVPI
jgi:hypothetical protein